AHFCPNFRGICMNGGTLDDGGNPLGGYDQAVEYEGILEYYLQCKHQENSIHDCVYNEKNTGKRKEKTQEPAKDHEGHNQNQKAKPLAKNNIGEEGVAIVGTNDAIIIPDSTSASTNVINNATIKVSNTTKANDNFVSPKDDTATSRDAQMNVSNTPIVNSGKNTTNGGRPSSASPDISTKDITKHDKVNMMEGQLAVTNAMEKELMLSSPSELQVIERIQLEQEEPRFEEVLPGRGICRRIIPGEKMKGGTITINLGNAFESLAASREDVDDPGDSSLNNEEEAYTYQEDNQKDKDEQSGYTKSDDETARRSIFDLSPYQNTSNNMSMAGILSHRG
ncbi:hypothetical protein A4A49_37095, partial [Nicotiana attenuata]